MPLKPTLIADKLRAYEEQTGKDSGTLIYEEYKALENFRPETVELSVETGIGKSTLFFSNFSKHHLIFTLDEGGHPDSNTVYVESHPLYRPDVCETVLGPTQQTLPKFQFSRPIDWVLFDGPHAFPMPQLEYYYVYPHLRPGSVIAFDDLTIPHIREMFLLLAEDDMYDLIDIVQGKLGFLRRTDHRAYDPLDTQGDIWYTQRYNLKGYAAAPGHNAYSVTPSRQFNPGDIISFAVGGNARDYQYHGWSYPEEDGTWTDGSDASISFQSKSERGNNSLQFKYMSDNEIVVTLGGVEIGRLPATGNAPAWGSVRLPSAHVSGAQASLLIFQPTGTRLVAGGHFLTERELGAFFLEMKYM